MISRYTYHGLTWVDLESPTREEIVHVAEEFSLPQLVSEELFQNTLHSKVDLYDNLIYLILHFPLITAKSGENNEQEVDFVIGKKFIVTTRYETIDPMHTFAKLFEVHSLLDREKMTSHAGFIFMEMMKEFYKSTLHELEDITNTIRHIERQIFTKNEKSIVKEISHASHKLLTFKQALRFHRNILLSYETASSRFFGSDYMYYASVITSEFNKVDTVLETHREILNELQRTNDSLLTSRTNDIVKRLTIITFVMMPFTVIGGLFYMNTTDNVIFIKTINEFYAVVGSMVALSILIFIYFKRKKWL